MPIVNDNSSTFAGVFQQLTRKDNNEVEYSDWTSSPGYTNVVQSPLQTPVSTKGGRINNRSKASKGNRSGPQTPVSNAGGKFSYLLGFFCLTFIISLA